MTPEPADPPADPIEPDDLDDDQIVDLEELVARWSDESALEDELAALGGLTDGVEWISLTEAEALANVSRSTLRAWYRGGRIPSRLMPGPHGVQRLVPRDAVIAQAAKSPRTASGSAPSARAAEPKEAPAVSDTVRLAELAVAEARERADRAEARAEAAERALHAALERAAAAEAELRIVREKPTAR